MGLTIFTGPGGAGSAGAPGTPGTTGPIGPAGASVELRRSTTHLQWRRTNETTWHDLIALAELGPAAGSEATEEQVALAIEVGTVTTVPYGQAASASLTHTSAGPWRLDLSIPTGAPGADGQPRFAGDGPPPEVIVGARPFVDQYLDRLTGLIYALV